MLHSNVILVSTAVLVLGAGVVVGRLSDRVAEIQAPLAPTTQPAHQHGRNWLSGQLNLTADQQQKIDAIWTATSQQIEKTFESRHDDEKAWDDAVAKIMTPQQIADYQKLNDQFRGKRDERFKERQNLIQQANEQSRALLDQDQQKKWDMLTKEMQNRHHEHGPGGMGPGRGPGHGPGMGDFPGFRHEDRPTTKPADGVEG